MIGGADCHRKTIGKCKQPLGQPPDDSKYRRIVRRRLHSEMRVDDRPEIVRGCEVGKQGLSRPWGNRDHDGVVTPQQQRIGLEFEQESTRFLKANTTQSLAETQNSTIRRDKGDGRIDEGSSKASRRNKGTTSFSAGSERIAQKRGRKSRRAFLWLGIEARNEER